MAGAIGAGGGYAASHALSGGAAALTEPAGSAGPGFGSSRLARLGYAGIARGLTHFGASTDRLGQSRLLSYWSPVIRGSQAVINVPGAPDVNNPGTFQSRPINIGGNTRADARYAMKRLTEYLQGVTDPAMKEQFVRERFKQMGHAAMPTNAVQAFDKFTARLTPSNPLWRLIAGRPTVPDSQQPGLIRSQSTRGSRAARLIRSQFTRGSGAMRFGHPLAMAIAYAAPSAVNYFTDKANGGVVLDYLNPVNIGSPKPAPEPGMLDFLLGGKKYF
jgi:hypothetical protein